MPVPSWVTILSALLTPMLAIFAIFIGLRQWQTAHSKLRLDLFDRRLKVHDQFRSTLNDVIRAGAVTQVELFGLLAGTHQVKWLFNEDVYDYIVTETYNKFHRFLTLEARLSTLAAGERSAVVDEQHEIVVWVLAQNAIIEAKFSPYMKMPK